MWERKDRNFKKKVERNVQAFKERDKLKRNKE